MSEDEWCWTVERETVEILYFRSRFVKVSLLSLRIGYDKKHHSISQKPFLHRFISVNPPFNPLVPFQYSFPRFLLFSSAEFNPLSIMGSSWDLDVVILVFSLQGGGEGFSLLLDIHAACVTYRFNGTMPCDIEQKRKRLSKSLQMRGHRSS